MTSAPPELMRARRLLLDHLDMHPGRTVSADLDPAEVGIVGDTRHVDEGDSYHLGEPEQAGSGYSVSESPRDRAGLSGYASAMDVGWFDVRVNGRRWTLRDFSRWLVDLCARNDPDTRDIREVIYSLDGRTVKRWDRLKRRSTGDKSHLTHTHISEHRDARGRRMVRLMTRWLQHIGLLAAPTPAKPAPKPPVPQPPQEGDDVNIQLRDGQEAVFTNPAVATGKRTWLLLSSDFGDAVVRVALKGQGGAWVAKTYQVTSIGDDVQVALMDKTTRKVSVVVQTLTQTSDAGKAVVSVDAVGTPAA